MASLYAIAVILLALLCSVSTSMRLNPSYPRQLDRQTEDEGATDDPYSLRQITLNAVDTLSFILTKQQVRNGISGIAKTMSEKLFDSFYQSLCIPGDCEDGDADESAEDEDEPVESKNTDKVLDVLNKSQTKIDKLELELKKLDDIHNWMQEWRKRSLL